MALIDDVLVHCFPFPFGNGREYVVYASADKYLQFIKRVLQSSYCRTPQPFGCQLYCFVLTGLLKFYESPIQVFRFLRKDENVVLVFGGCTNNLIAVKADNHWLWVHHYLYGAPLQALIHLLSEHPFDVSTKQHPITLLAGLTANPGHALLNDACSILFLTREQTLPPLHLHIGPQDYWGLSSTLNHCLIPSNSINYRHGCHSLSLYPNSIRSFAFSLELSSLASTLPEPGCSFPFLNRHSPDHCINLFLAMRSDRKRNLLADPLSTLNQILSHIYNCLSRSQPIPKLSVFLDTYSEPCDKSTFTCNSSMIHREKRFSSYLYSKLSEALPHITFTELSGLSFLAKRQLVRNLNASFLGYAGAPFAMYFSWQAYNAPSLLFGSQSLLTGYTNLDDRTLVPFQLALDTFSVNNSTHTLSGLTDESSSRGYPFEYFTMPELKIQHIQPFVNSLIAYNETIMPLTSKTS